MIKFAQPMLDDETIEAVSAVLRSQWIATGPQTAAFEDALSATLGNRPVWDRPAAACTVSYEALHTTTLGRRLGYRDGDFPHAARIGRETLSLPLHVALSNDDVDYVCGSIAEVWQ